MSNPAVVKSDSLTIQNQPFFLDDNYGESIHIHFGDIRLDFSFERLDAFIADLDDILCDDCFGAFGTDSLYDSAYKTINQRLVTKAYIIKKRLRIYYKSLKTIRKKKAEGSVCLMIESR